MAYSSRALPPLQALRAFHAAARHPRFRDAAEELGVTESAISHQIRRLEEHLHVALFERVSSGVSLTAAGEQYFNDIDPAFRQIHEASRRFLGSTDRPKVVVTLPPSVAMLWLVPALAAMERACPGIDLQLLSTPRVCSLRREQIDLAIRHGQGEWDDVDATYLFGDTATPVCAPDYLAEELAADPAAAIRKRRLIVNELRPIEWEEWAAAHHLPPPNLTDALKLEGLEQAIQAAERGVGIAMGHRPLINEQLQQGRIVTPFNLVGPSRACYYLCQAAGVVPSKPVREVARWLLTHAKAAQGPTMPSHEAALG